MFIFTESNQNRFSSQKDHIINQIPGWIIKASESTYWPATNVIV